MTDINIVNNILLVNYIYLDVDERRNELKHKYLITSRIVGEEIRTRCNHINLNYNHPVKIGYFGRQQVKFI